MSIGVHGVVCIFKHASLALGLTLASFIPEAGTRREHYLDTRLESDKSFSYLIHLISFDDDLATIDDVDTLARSCKTLAADVVDVAVTGWLVVHLLMSFDTRHRIVVPQ